MKTAYHSMTENLNNGFNRLTLLQSPASEVLSTLPKFDSIADALEFSIEAVSLFAAEDNLQGMAIDPCCEDHVDSMLDTVSFGVVAVAAALYWMNDTKPGDKDRTTRCWRVAHDLVEDCDISGAAKALDVTAAHLAGWMIAMDAVCEGWNLVYASTLLETNDKRLPTTREWFTDVSSIAETPAAWIASAWKLAAEIRRRNS